ncbi:MULTISPECIES: DUF3558 family protein [Streptomyces]|uniref:DUF3558 domain-containing protein n=1 Tax=Streptomyces spororaveus TaxID=284039 RepID=A0ABQ3TDN4_9ACTN|nr:MULTISPECIES: DUF3558 family protein [Streptomyces]MCM9081075.1 DUF3558 domain-containing protein [Streptomyces spororaveus]MCX5304478.1 DUF3558 domain-containing protein [Streptomyces sp. NBC_00160]GHI78533.1 hypothetical protein Sspor_40940 [Streptomyces spororaveus]
MHRSASRLTRVLACAAVPVILTVAGCSSDSGKDTGSKGEKTSGSSSSAKPNPKSSKTLEKATFAALPDPCKALQAPTIETLVPEVKDKNGQAPKSNDVATRTSCAWNGLDADGLKGSQFRWLSLSFFRYDSDAALGSANKRAEEQYNKEIETAKSEEGAQAPKAEAVAGIGDQATSVIYTVKKDVDSFNTSIVARAQNVVVRLDYNGAAYEGAGAPDHAKLLQDAITAAKEAVTSVDAANKAPAEQPQSPQPQ